MIKKYFAALAALLVFAQSALAVEIECQGNITEALRANAGQQIFISAGDCTFDGVEYCDITDVFGAGVTRTRLYVSNASKSGFSFLRGNRCIGKGRGASQSIITDLSIISPGLVTTATATFGLEVRASITAKRVAIQGFVHGFDVYGNVTKDGTHANRTHFEEVTAKGAMHAGGWVRGPDTNVSMFTGIDAGGNCRDASRWLRRFDAERNAEEGGRYQPGVCAGYVNRAQFGTSDSAISGAFNMDEVQINKVCGHIPEKDPKRRICEYPFYYPAHWYEGPQNASVCVGCYREGKASTWPASHFDKAAIAVGGFVAFEGEGLQIGPGPHLNRLKVFNRKNPAVPISVSFGDFAATDTFMQFDGPDMLPGGVRMTTLRFKLDVPRLQFRWDLNNQVATEWIYLQTGVTGSKLK